MADTLLLLLLLLLLSDSSTLHVCPCESTYMILLRRGPIISYDYKSTLGFAPFAMTPFGFGWQIERGLSGWLARDSSVLRRESSARFHEASRASGAGFYASVVPRQVRRPGL